MMHTNQQKTGPYKILLMLSLTVIVIMAVTLVIGLMPSAAAQEDAALATEWQVVFEDDFESGIKADWTVSDDDGATHGEYYWSTTSFTASQGTTSIWATGGGSDGNLLVPGTDNYPPYARSSIGAGPFNFADGGTPRLLFDYWIESEEAFDVLWLRGSTNDTDYPAIGAFDGSSDGWQSAAIDLSDFADAPDFWFKFTFSSNDSVEESGVFLDNVRLELRTDSQILMPLISKLATPTPSPTPSPSPVPLFSYYDDFSDPNSGWPRVDNTHVSNDCFKWYYSDGTYNADICDDRTDVKVSPGIQLPNGDYELESRSRFKAGGGWWTSYGIMFDAKEEPDPGKPDLGDYYMVWVLWEGIDKHKWKILKDVPGDQIDLTEWEILDGAVYNYGSNGTDFNDWKIVRTATEISVYVNGHHLRTIAENRPTTNYQVLFGLYTATYETGTRSNPLRSSFDFYRVDEINGSSSSSQLTRPETAGGTYSSGSFDLEGSLPGNGE